MGVDTAAPTVALTGASGLLGGNLAAQLLAEGATVRATRRRSSRADHLALLHIQWMEADLGNVDALTRAFEGAEAVFHCAAEVTPTRSSGGAHRGTNVQGTQNVLNAAEKAGVRRVVHCSSVVTTSLAAPGAPDVTEDDPWNFPEHGLDDTYARTKREAEQAALAANGPRLEVVVVNPAFMLGPLDARPSSGKLILEVAQGRVFVVPSGVNSFVDVRDVARGMTAARRQGRPGERYILGGENLSYGAVFQIFAGELGMRAPRLRLPDAVVKLAGALGDLGERVVRRPLPLNSAVTQYAVERGHRFSSAKAARELGYTITPIRTAVRDAVAWFRAHGMLRATA